MRNTFTNNIDYSQNDSTPILIIKFQNASLCWNLHENWDADRRILQTHKNLQLCNACEYFCHKLQTFPIQMEHEEPKPDNFSFLNTCICSYVSKQKLIDIRQKHDDLVLSKNTHPIKFCITGVISSKLL